jgi:hypothetical protein
MKGMALRVPGTRLWAVALAVSLSGAPALAASRQTPPDPPAASGSTRAEPQTPKPAVSTPELDRIREALAKPSNVELNGDQLRFYMRILARQPSIKDMIGSFDLKNGPTRRGNAMTHQEFLNMVTPKEMYSSAGIRATEMLQFALVNALAQAVIIRGIEALKNAKSEKEIAEIRARIDRELAALRGGGRPEGDD